MEDFTRDILEVTVDILLTQGILDDEGADSFIAEVEKDAEATFLFDTLTEQARLFGFEQGYDEGVSNAVWYEDEGGGEE